MQVLIIFTIQIIIHKYLQLFLNNNYSIFNQGNVRNICTRQLIIIKQIYYFTFSLYMYYIYLFYFCQSRAIRAIVWNTIKVVQSENMCYWPCSVARLMLWFNTNAKKLTHKYISPSYNILFNLFYINKLVKLVFS